MGIQLILPDIRSLSSSPVKIHERLQSLVKVLFPPSPFLYLLFFPNLEVTSEFVPLFKVHWYSEFKRKAEKEERGRMKER